MKIPLIIDDETRPIWECAKRAAEEVAAWPAWKHNELPKNEGNVYKLGIVGSEAAKFTPETEAKARDVIRNLLTIPGVTGVVSGACHLGGIDAWAAEIGRELGLYVVEFAPKRQSWLHYKARNLQIAEVSDEVHCITVKELPANYTGMRFKLCYHCGTNQHVKSGGCWTMHKARAMGKAGVLHVI